MGATTTLSRTSLGVWQEGRHCVGGGGHPAWEDAHTYSPHLLRLGARTCCRRRTSPTLSHSQGRRRLFLCKSSTSCFSAGARSLGWAIRWDWRVKLFWAVHTDGKCLWHCGLHLKDWHKLSGVEAKANKGATATHTKTSLGVWQDGRHCVGRGGTQRGRTPAPSRSRSEIRGLSPRSDSRARDSRPEP